MEIGAGDGEVRLRFRWVGGWVGPGGDDTSLMGQASSYLPGKPQLGTPTRDGEQIAQVYCKADLLSQFCLVLAKLSYLFRESKFAFQFFFQ